MPWYQIRTCCLCLDTAKGSILASVSSIVVSLLTFASIILGLVFWDEVKKRIEIAYKEIGLGGDVIDTIVKVVWWGNIFTLIVIIIYIILCVLLIVGVRREQYKHMIPWISVTSMLLPFLTVSFFLQLIFGIIGGGVIAVLIPAIIVLIWCGFWLYGFICVLSHYKVLKGDIHRPVATLFKRS